MRQDISKMDASETKWRGIEWINLAQGRQQSMALVNIAMKTQVP
jgi:hypothetical protein